MFLDRAPGCMTNSGLEEGIEVDGLMQAPLGLERRGHRNVGLKPSWVDVDLVGHRTLDPGRSLTTPAPDRLGPDDGDAIGVPVANTAGQRVDVGLRCVSSVVGQDGASPWRSDGVSDDAAGVGISPGPRTTATVSNW